MRYEFSIKKRVLKKTAALFFSAVYLQVNVAWCGVPSLPVASYFTHLSPIQFLKKSLLKKELFVFHRPYDDDWTRQQNNRQDKRPADKTADTQAAQMPTGKKVNDIKDPSVKGILESLVGDLKNKATVLLKDVLNSDKLSDEQKNEIIKVFGDNSNLKVNVWKLDNGQVQLNVQSPAAGATITLTPNGQQGGVKVDVQVMSRVQLQTTPTNLSVQKNPATSSNPKVPTPQQVRQQERELQREVKREMNKEAQLDGKIVKIGGQEVKLKWDSKNQQLIVLDPKTNQQIQGKVFVTAVKDAKGNVVSMKYGIHHIEVKFQKQTQIEGGQAFGLKWDDKNKRIQVIDLKTGAILDGNAAGKTVVDASGKKIVIQNDAKLNGQTVLIGGREVEVEVPVLVAKALGDVGAGQTFKDGKMGEEAGKPGRAAGGLNSSNLDVTVNDDGQILFTGKNGGGEVAFSVGMQITGTSLTPSMDNAEFQPITAGSHNITIKDQSGNVLAQAGDKQIIKGADGQDFGFAIWKVSPGAEKISIKNENVLSHFGITHNSSALVNNEGFSVGRVHVTPEGRTQIIGLASERGKAAMTSLFFNQKDKFTPGGVHENIDVGMTGEQGTAVVFLNSKSTLPQTTQVLIRLEGFNAKGKNDTQITAAIQNIVAKSEGIKSYDLTVRVQVTKDSTAELRISGGRDNVDVMSSPALSTENRTLAQNIFGNDNVQKLENNFTSQFTKIGQPAPASPTFVYSKVGQDQLRITGTFKTPDTGVNASLTISINKNDTRAPPAISYDRNAAVFFHGESFISQGEGVANQAITKKGGDGSNGEFSYSSIQGQVSITKTFDLYQGGGQPNLKGTLTIIGFQEKNQVAYRVGEGTLHSQELGIEVRFGDKANFSQAAQWLTQGVSDQNSESGPLQNLFTDANRNAGFLGASLRINDTTSLKGQWTQHDNKIQSLFTVTDHSTQRSISYLGNKANFSQASDALKTLNTLSFADITNATKSFQKILTPEAFKAGLIAASVGTDAGSFEAVFQKDLQLNVTTKFTGLVITHTNAAGSIRYLAGEKLQINDNPLNRLAAGAVSLLRGINVGANLQNPNNSKLTQVVGQAIEIVKQAVIDFIEPQYFKTGPINGTSAASQEMIQLQSSEGYSSTLDSTVGLFMNKENSIDLGILDVSFAREGHSVHVTYAGAVRTMDKNNQSVKVNGAVVTDTNQSTGQTIRTVSGFLVDAAGKTTTSPVDGRKNIGQFEYVGRMPNVSSVEISLMRAPFEGSVEGIISVSQEVEGYTVTANFSNNISMRKPVSNAETTESGSVITKTDHRTNTTVRYAAWKDKSTGIISDGRYDASLVMQKVQDAKTADGVVGVIKTEFRYSNQNLGVLSVSREIDDRVVSGSYNRSADVTLNDGTKTNVQGAEIVDTNLLTGRTTRTINGLTQEGKEVRGFENSRGVAIALDNTTTMDDARGVLETTFEKPLEGVLSATKEVDGHTITGSHADKIEINKSSLNAGRKASGALIQDMNQKSGVLTSYIKGKLFDYDGKTVLDDIDGGSAANTAANDLSKVDTISQTKDILQSVFGKSVDGLLSVSRDVGGYTIFGSYGEQVETINDKGEKIFVSGALLTDANHETGVISRSIRGYAVDELGNKADFVDGRFQSENLSRNLGTATTAADAGKYLDKTFRKPVEGVLRLSKEVGDLIIGGSYGHEVETTVKTESGNVILHVSGAQIDINNQTTKSHVVTINGVAKETGKDVDGLKLSSGILLALDGANDGSSTKEALVKIFGQANVGVLEAGREINSHSITGSYTRGIEQKYGDKRAVIEGALITDLDQQTKTSIQTISGVVLEGDSSIKGKTVKGHELGAGIQRAVGNGLNEDQVKDILEYEFSSGQLGVISATRQINGRIISGRHELIQTKDSDGKSTSVESVAVITDKDTVSGTILQTTKGVVISGARKGQLIDGRKAGELLSADVASSNSSDIVIDKLGKGFKKETRGVLSITREIGGLVISGSYDRGVDAKQGRKSTYEGAAIGIVNNETGSLARFMIGSERSEKGEILRSDVDGRKTGQGEMKKLDEVSYEESKEIAKNDTASGSLMTDGVLSVGRKGADEMFVAEFQRNLTVKEKGQEEAKFTGAEMSVTDFESGKTIRYLSGSFEQNGTKFTHDQTKAAEKLKGELRGLSFTKAQEKAGEVIYSGGILNGVFGVEGREGSQSFSAQYNEAVAGDRKQVGAFVAKTDGVTGQTVVGVYGETQDLNGNKIEDLNSLNLADQTKNDLGKLSFEDSKKAAISKIDELAKQGVVQIMRREGSQFYSITPNSRYEVSSDGVTRAATKQDEGYELKTVSGKFMVASKKVDQRSFDNTFARMEGQLRTAKGLNTSQEIQEFMTQGGNENLSEVQIESGQDRILSVRNNDGHFSVSAADLKTGVQVALQFVHTRAEANTYLDAGNRMHTVEEVRDFLRNDFSARGENFSAKGMTIVDLQGNRNQMFSEKLDVVHIQSGESKKQSLYIIEDVTDTDGKEKISLTRAADLTKTAVVNPKDSRLIGAKSVQWEKVGGVQLSATELDHMKSFGYGQTSLELADGIVVESLLDDSGQLQTYEFGGKWKDASNGRDYSGTFASNAILSHGNQGYEVFNIQNGSMDSRASVDGSISDVSVVVEAIKANGEDLEGWNKIVAQYDLHVDKATLIGVTIPGLGGNIGNIILSDTKDAKNPVSVIHQIEDFAFSNNQSFLLKKINNEEGRFTVQVGVLGSNGSFAIESSYGYADSGKTNVTYFDPDGNSVSAVVSVSNVSNIRSQLKEQSRDVRSAIQLVREGWIPSGAKSVRAVDKNGNGAEVKSGFWSNTTYEIRTHERVFLNKDGSIQEVARTEMKYEKGKREEATFNQTFTFYDDRQVVKEVSVDENNMENTYSLDRESGIWSHSQRDLVIDPATKKLFIVTGILVGVVVAAVSLLLAIPTGGASLAGLALAKVLIGTAVVAALSAFGTYNGLSSISRNKNVEGWIEIGVSIIPGLGAVFNLLSKAVGRVAGFITAATSATKNSVTAARAIYTARAAYVVAQAAKGMNLVIGGYYSVESALAWYDNPTLGNAVRTLFTAALTFFTHRSLSRNVGTARTAMMDAKSGKGLALTAEPRGPTAATKPSEPAPATSSAPQNLSPQKLQTQIEAAQGAAIASASGGIARALIGTYYEYSLRNVAGQAISRWIDVSTTEGWFSKKGKEAFVTAVKAVASSEIYWIARGIGAPLKRVTDALGARSLASQAALMGGAGILAAAGLHLGFGGSLESLPMSMVEGLLVGLALLIGSKGAGLLGKNLDARSARNEKLLSQRAKEKLSTVGQLSTTKVTFLRGSLIAKQAVITILREVGPLGINVGLGVAAEGLSNTVGNLIVGKSLGDGLGNALLRGAYVGAFVGGALRAVGNWGNASQNMVRSKNLAGNSALNFGSVRPSYLFAFERVAAGFGMAMWEVTANSLEMDTNNFFSIRGAWNPFTWANGVEKLYAHATGKPIHEKQDAITRFKETFKNISKLHPFFGFGRPGINLGSAPFQAISSRLGSIPITAGPLKMLSGRAGAFVMSSMVINPINIKTFELYEDMAVEMGYGVGFFDLKTDSQGNLTYEEGFLVGATEGDQTKVEIARFIGFINAPIHASKGSGIEAQIGQKLRETQVSFLEFIPGIGAIARAAKEAGRTEATELAISLISDLGGRSQSDTTTPYRFKGNDGQVYEIGGKEAQQILAQAKWSLAANPQLQAFLAQLKDPQALDLVMSADGTFRQVEPTKTSPTQAFEAETQGSGIVATLKLPSKQGETGREVRVFVGQGGQLRVILPEGTQELSSLEKSTVITITVRGTKNGKNREFAFTATLGEFVAADSKIKLPTLDGRLDLDFATSRPQKEKGEGIIQISRGKVSVEEALKIVVDSQVGKGEYTADQIQSAREVLGLQAGDRVFKADAGLIFSAQSQMISNKTPAELRDIIGQAADGKINIVFGVLALARLDKKNGLQKSQDFALAHKMGLTGDVLKVLAGLQKGITVDGKTVEIKVRTDEAGKRVIDIKEASIIWKIFSREALKNLPKPIKDALAKNESIQIELGEKNSWKEGKPRSQ